MNDPATMGGGQRVGNLDANQECALQLQWVSADQLPDVATLDVLHCNEVVSFGFVKVEDGGDIWMIERGGKPGLTLKPLEVCFFCGQLCRQYFDYDGATKLSIRGFVHGALTANADLFEDLIIL